jgi:chemotaxis protein CheY-P-specific phosphatase CheC
MLVAEISEILTGAVAEVLETMYFATIVGIAQSDIASGDEWIGVSLRFRGALTGVFGMRAPVDSARTLADNFLGGSESELRGVEVLGEMANMICGSVLSRIAPNKPFDLDTPVSEVCDWHAWRQHREKAIYEIEDGWLGLWLDLER